MPIILVLTVVAIAITMLLMYAHYKMQMRANAEHQAVVEETLIVQHEQNNQLKALVDKLGPRYLTAQGSAISGMLKTGMWNKLAVRGAAGKALEEFLFYFLDKVQGAILEELIHDGTPSMFQEDPDQHFFKISGTEGETDVVVLQFTVTKIPLTEIEEADKAAPFSRDKTSVAVINSLTIYTPQECQGECPINTITTANDVVKDCVTPVRRVLRTPEATLAYTTFVPQNGNWRYCSMPKEVPTPQILSLSYPSLQIRGERTRMTITKLIKALRESWTTGEVVRVAFLGEPGTGKSRLLRILAGVAQECDMRVSIINVGTLKDVLDNGGFDQIPAGKNGTLVIVDEAQSVPIAQLADLNQKMEGVIKNANISFAIAANGELDPATLRSGRIDLALMLGALSEDDTAALYAAVKSENPGLHWSPLPDKASLTLAQIYGLGRKKQFSELL